MRYARCYCTCVAISLCLFLCATTGWSQRPPSLDALEDRLQSDVAPTELRPDSPTPAIRPTTTPENSLGFGFGELDIDAAGALVRTLNVRSPADVAGIRLGDRIVSINNMRIVDVAELRRALARIKPGTATTVDVVRDGKPLSITINAQGSERIPLPKPKSPTDAVPQFDPPRIPPPKVKPLVPPKEIPLPADSDAEAPTDEPSILKPSIGKLTPTVPDGAATTPDPSVRSAYPPSLAVPTKPSFGVYPSTLTSSVRRQLDVRVFHGALIAKVVKDSIADRHGLVPGDVIVAFNGCRIDDAEDLYNAVRATPAGSRVNVLYHRRGRTYSREVAMGSAVAPPSVSLKPGVADPVNRAPSAVERLEGRLNAPSTLPPVESDENAALREHVRSLQDTIDALESRIRILEGGR